MASDNEACESDPNFAVICGFLEKFGSAIDITNVDFLALQRMLEDTHEIAPELVDIHIKLLRKARKNVKHVDRWERSLILACHTFNSKDAWAIERFGYKKAQLSVKLRVLKELLEMQFDHNTKFKNQLNNMTAENLRAQPLGRDKLGNNYWFQTDNNYQIRVYKEDLDEETWKLMAKDREGLIGLLNELSDGELKLSSEDSNSAAEKLALDTGQTDSNSCDTMPTVEFQQASAENTKDGVEYDNAESNSSLPKKIVPILRIKSLTELTEKGKSNFSMTDEDSDPEPRTFKKRKLDEEDPIVSSEIEEPVMYISGNGTGKECKTGNKRDGKPGKESAEDPSVPKSNTISEKKTEDSSIKEPTSSGGVEVTSTMGGSAPKKMFFFGPGSLTVQPTLSLTGPPNDQSNEETLKSGDPENEPENSKKRKEADCLREGTEVPKEGLDHSPSNSSDLPDGKNKEDCIEEETEAKVATNCAETANNEAESSLSKAEEAIDLNTARESEHEADKPEVSEMNCEKTTSETSKPESVAQEQSQTENLDQPSKIEDALEDSEMNCKEITSKTFESENVARDCAQQSQADSLDQHSKIANEGLSSRNENTENAVEERLPMEENVNEESQLGETVNEQMVLKTKDDAECEEISEQCLIIDENVDEEHELDTAQKKEISLENEDSSESVAEEIQDQRLKIDEDFDDESKLDETANEEVTSKNEDSLVEEIKEELGERLEIDENVEEQLKQDETQKAEAAFKNEDKTEDIVREMREPLSEQSLEIDESIDEERKLDGDNEDNVVEEIKGQITDHPPKENVHEESKVNESENGERDDNTRNIAEGIIEQPHVQEEEEIKEQLPNEQLVIEENVNEVSQNVENVVQGIEDQVRDRDLGIEENVGEGGLRAEQRLGVGPEPVQINANVRRVYPLIYPPLPPFAFRREDLRREVVAAVPTNSTERVNEDQNDEISSTVRETYIDYLGPAPNRPIDPAIYSRLHHNIDIFRRETETNSEFAVSSSVRRMELDDSSGSEPFGLDIMLRLPGLRNREAENLENNSNEAAGERVTRREDEPLFPGIPSLSRLTASFPGPSSTNAHSSRWNDRIPSSSFSDDTTKDLTVSTTYYSPLTESKSETESSEEALIIHESPTSEDDSSSNDIPRLAERRQREVLSGNNNVSEASAIGENVERSRSPETIRGESVNLNSVESTTTTSRVLPCEILSSSSREQENDLEVINRNEEIAETNEHRKQESDAAAKDSTAECSLNDEEERKLSEENKEEQNLVDEGANEENPAKESEEKSETEKEENEAEETTDKAQTSFDDKNDDDVLKKEDTSSQNEEDKSATNAFDQVSSDSTENGEEKVEESNDKLEKPANSLDDEDNEDKILESKEGTLHSVSDAEMDHESERNATKQQVCSNAKNESEETTLLNTENDDNHDESNAITSNEQVLFDVSERKIEETLLGSRDEDDIDKSDIDSVDEQKLLDSDSADIATKSDVIDIDSDESVLNIDEEQSPIEASTTESVENEDNTSVEHFVDMPDKVTTTESEDKSPDSNKDDKTGNDIKGGTSIDIINKDITKESEEKELSDPREENNSESLVNDQTSLENGNEEIEEKTEGNLNNNENAEGNEIEKQTEDDSNRNKNDEGKEVEKQTEDDSNKNENVEGSNIEKKIEEKSNKNENGEGSDIGKKTEESSNENENVEENANNQTQSLEETNKIDDKNKDETKIIPDIQNSFDPNKESEKKYDEFSDDEDILCNVQYSFDNTFDSSDEENETKSDSQTVEDHSSETTDHTRPLQIDEDQKITDDKEEPLNLEIKKVRVTNEEIEPVFPEGKVAETKIGEEIPNASQPEQLPSNCENEIDKVEKVESEENISKETLQTSKVSSEIVAEKETEKTDEKEVPQEPTSKIEDTNKSETEGTRDDDTGLTANNEKEENVKSVSQERTSKIEVTNKSETEETQNDDTGLTANNEKEENVRSVSQERTSKIEVTDKSEIEETRSNDSGLTTDDVVISDPPPRGRRRRAEGSRQPTEGILVKRRNRIDKTFAPAQQDSDTTETSKIEDISEVPKIESPNGVELEKEHESNQSENKESSVKSKTEEGTQKLPEATIPIEEVVSKENEENRTIEDKKINKSDENLETSDVQQKESEDTKEDEISEPIVWGRKTRAQKQKTSNNYSPKKNVPKKPVKGKKNAKENNTNVADKKEKNVKKVSDKKIVEDEAKSAQVKEVVGRSLRSAQNSAQSTPSNSPVLRKILKGKGRKKKGGGQPAVQKVRDIECLSLLDSSSPEQSVGMDVDVSSEKDPLANSDAEDTKPQPATATTQSLTSFSIDFDGSEIPVIPVIPSLRATRKRGRGAGNQSETTQVVKKAKVKGRAIDSALRRSIEEKRKDIGSSDENDGPPKDKKPANKNKADTKKPKSTKNSRLLKNLGIDPDQLDAINAVIPVRQSRRIAQIKIREEANTKVPMTKEESKAAKKKNKKLEEELKRKERKRLKLEAKQAEEMAEKKKRKKKHRGRFNSGWKSSSGSSSSYEEEEEEIAEYSEDELPLQFKSDHEFSPESDMEDDDGTHYFKRARTVRKEPDEVVDDFPCQKCGKSDHPEWILLCDICDNGWHCSCLRPALFVIPEGDWYCPPCQHEKLIQAIQIKLSDFDKMMVKKEMEDRRKERLAYVGISLNNVLPAKESKKHHQKSYGSSDSEHSESSEEKRSAYGSDSESSYSDEPIYQLRQRRQAHSYKFTDYDELINSAIGEEGDKDLNPEPKAGKGKDISTIINAEKKEREEEEKLRLKEGGGGEKDFDEDLPPVVPKDAYYDEEQGASKSRVTFRKKKKKLNSLEVNSEDDIDSDEDFKGTGSDSEEDDFIDDDSYDSECGKYGRRSAPVRRSTRARVSRYDADFINDDSDNGKNRKKKKRPWSESESSESDGSWGGRRKRKQTNRRTSRKSKKKKKMLNDSDLESYRKKPKIKYGGLDSDDEVSGRRTRGKRTSYLDTLGSDSEDEKKRKRVNRIESDESEYVAEEDNEDEEKSAEDVSEEDAGAKNDNADEDDNEEEGEEKKDEPKLSKLRIRIRRPVISDSEGDEEEEDEAQNKPAEIVREEDNNSNTNASFQSNNTKDSDKPEEIMRKSDSPVVPSDPSSRSSESLKIRNEIDTSNDSKLEESFVGVKPTMGIKPVLVNDPTTDINFKESSKHLVDLSSVPKQSDANLPKSLLEATCKKLFDRKQKESQRETILKPAGDKFAEDAPTTPKKVVSFMSIRSQNETARKAPPLSANNKDNDELSEPPGVALPLFSELAGGRTSPDNAPKKRKGRGKGKKTLAAEAAKANTPADAQANLSPAKKKPTNASATLNLSKNIKDQEGRIEVAAPPQPFAQSEPEPSVITRMLQSSPIETQKYPIIRPKQFARMVDRDVDNKSPYSTPPPESDVPPNNHYGTPPPRPAPPAHFPQIPPPPPAVHYPKTGPPQHFSGGPPDMPPYAYRSHEHVHDQNPPSELPSHAEHLPPRAPYPNMAPPNYNYDSYPPSHAAKEDLQPYPPYSEPYDSHVPPPGQEQGGAPPKGFEEETGGEFGGLVSYFSSQHDHDLET